MTDEMVDGAGPSQRGHHAGGDGSATRPRMSAKRKQGAVLRLLRGEPIEFVPPHDACVVGTPGIARAQRDGGGAQRLARRLPGGG